MAYLNVRERRIEATIAYVGPELGGKGTNFEQLKLATGRLGKIEPSGAEDDVLSWQPPEQERFRDCDVHVRVVAQRGAPVTTESIRAFLRDADGVVVVVDAHPSAVEKNRASFAAVRDALARSDRKDIALVLQVNKTDLPGALSTDDVITTLDAGAYRHVPACATEGRGVVETLEAALNDVLGAMQRAPEATQEDSVLTNRPPGQIGTSTVSAGGAPTADGGHPLLAALRQVLRETVREHVDEVAARGWGRVEASLASIEKRLASTEEACEKLGALVTIALQKPASDKASQQLIDLTQETDARVEALGRGLATRASKDDLAGVSTKLDRVRDELKAELVRTLETRSRADREHLATATTALKKQVEAVSSDVRAADVRANLNVIAEVVGRVAERTDVVIGRVDAITPRLDQVEASVKQRSAALEKALTTMRDEVGESFAGADEKTTAVRARVDDIVEEMKKQPKKGWFA